MDKNEIKPVDAQKPEQKPNLLFAVLAAIGLALVGCVLYGILYYVGYIAWIVSYITVLISAWGYKHFNKKMDWKGYLTVSIVSVAGLIIAMFLSLTIYVSKQFNTSFATAFNELFKLIGDRADIRSAVIRDGILTAVFTVLGILSYLFYEKKADKLNLKKKENGSTANVNNNANVTNENSKEKTETPAQVASDTKAPEKEAAPVAPKVEEKKLTAVPEEVKATKPRTTQKKTQTKQAASKPLTIKPVVSSKPKTTTKSTTATKKTTDKKGE